MTSKVSTAWPTTMVTILSGLIVLYGASQCGSAQDRAAQDGAKSDKEAAKAPMPVYITPFYDSKGPTVSVGENSQKLASADAKTILDLAAEMKKDKDKLRPEAMYVLAIRLYDLGHKDESVYWFYTAQYRGRLFSSILDKASVGGLGSEAFEMKQAYVAFNQLAGPFINGYGFGDLPKLEKTLTVVLEESKVVPNFSELYPKVKFVSQDKWSGLNDDMSAGLAKMMDTIKNNADTIKAERKKNGLDGKY